MTFDEILFQNTQNEAKSFIKEDFVPFENIDTLVTHSGFKSTETEDLGCPVICPISLSTTFQQMTPSVYKYDYSRANNFTREAFENCLTKIENGLDTICFSSGLAAINSVMSLLDSDGHLLVMDDVYGGTIRLIKTLVKEKNLKFDSVDLSDVSLVEKSIKNNTRMIWIETPTNPMMKVVDIARIVSTVKAINPDCIVAVDNTFMSPYFQRPFDSGADIVVHSITKYINGHSDVVMGCAIVRDDQEIVKKLKFAQMAFGAVPSPFDCYLALRGVRTLAVRMMKHYENSLTVAKYFENHPKVEKLIYPGLPSHPQYQVQKSQTRGNSGMLALYIQGDAEKATKFVQNLKIFCLAESLGGFESLVEIPAQMTHAGITQENKKLLGIHENFIRMSIGCEDVKDLVKDIEQALDSL